MAIPHIGNHIFNQTISAILVRIVLIYFESMEAFGLPPLRFQTTGNLVDKTSPNGIKNRSRQRFQGEKWKLFKIAQRATNNNSYPKPVKNIIRALDPNEMP